MPQEILYTSAQQGLRQGTSGFCTVSSTAGMEPNLGEFLEGFSGYPHPYKPPDLRTARNPPRLTPVVRRDRAGKDPPCAGRPPRSRC